MWRGGGGRKWNINLHFSWLTFLVQPNRGEKISGKPHKVFVHILVIGEIVRSGKGSSWDGVSRCWRLTADLKPYLISVVIPFSHYRELREEKNPIFLMISIDKSQWTFILFFSFLQRAEQPQLRVTGAKVVWIILPSSLVGPFRPWSRVVMDKSRTVTAEKSRLGAWRCSGAGTR